MGIRYTVTKEGKQGQLRPYGPSYNCQRVFFERLSSLENGDPVWIPFDIIEDRVRDWLKENKRTTRFTEYVYKKEDGQSGYFSERFGYLRKISPGLWEYQTWHEFCD